MNCINLKNKLSSTITLILMLSLFVNIYSVWWGLPSFSGWAIDEVIPKFVLDGINHSFANEWYSVYPPFHFYLLTFLYSPFLILAHFNIINFENLFNYTTLFYIGRICSVVMGTAIVLIVFLCGREIFNKKASLIAALITTLNCTFIYYSKTTNVEVPYLFWFSLSLLFYIKILKYDKFSDYLLFAIASVTSICTKDQAYGLYIFPAILIVINNWISQKQKNPAITYKKLLFDKKIMISLTLGIILFIIYHNFLFNWNGFIAHVNELTGPASYNSGDFFKRPENNIPEHLKLLLRSLSDIRHSLGWILSCLSILGLAIAVFQKRKNYLLLSLLIPGISYYLLFISIILYSRDRFMLPLCIILSFFGGQLISDLIDLSKKFPKIYQNLVSVSIALIFFYTFVYSFSVNILMTQDSRYYVENWMRKNIDPKSLVLSVGLEEYLPRSEVQKFKTKNVEIPYQSYLEAENFDYIITTNLYDITRYENYQESNEYQAFVNFNKNPNYKLVLKYQSHPKWNLLDAEKISSNLRYKSGNLNKINPEISISKKVN